MLYGVAIIDYQYLREKQDVFRAGCRASGTAIQGQGTSLLLLMFAQCS